MPMIDAEFIEQMVENSPDGLIAISPEGKILFWNPGAENIFGYSSEEAVGCLLKDLTTPDNLVEETQQAIENTLENGFAAYESVRQRKDGVHIDITTSMKVVTDAKGGIRFIAVNKKDTTSIKVLRDTRMIEARFRNLLESVPDAITIVNIAGRIVLINSQVEKLFSFTRNELLGKPIEILIPQRFRTEDIGFRTGSFTEPKLRTMGEEHELFGLRKDGTEFPVEISLSPLATEEGIFAISTIRDITERKLQQEEIRLKNLELEEKNRRVQEATRLKSEFLANMSHELRTPLNGIIGFSEFLIDEKPGALNAKQREYLSDILNSGKHLLQLINDVLDLAKVEAGKMEVLPELFSVKKAIDEVCSVIAPAAINKEISVNLFINANVKTAMLDQAKFRQILYNLLSNAIKFTHPKGKVEINVTIENDVALKLEIKDTGIGIKKEDFNRLFKEFEQIDSSMARLYEGTGLGLTLTKKIIDLQNGTISVESEFGKGSTFTVLLPLTNNGRIIL